MASMLGRRQVPGCCPGTRAGCDPGPDCSGGGSTGARAAKRAEQQFVAAEAWRETALITNPRVVYEDDPAPFFDEHDIAGIERYADYSDCRHGCNGDEITGGYASERCDWTCHPDLSLDPERADRLEAIVARLEARYDQRD